MIRRRGSKRWLASVSEVRQEGRRWAAFYAGCRAFRENRPGNPYKSDSEAWSCWQSGWKYAESAP